MNAYANIIAVLERGNLEAAAERSGWFSSVAAEVYHEECNPALAAELQKIGHCYDRWFESELDACTVEEAEAYFNDVPF